MSIELLNAKQLANLTGLKLPRIYELCREKKIPHVVVGERQYLFPRARIERWLGIPDKPEPKNVTIVQEVADERK